MSVAHSRTDGFMRRDAFAAAQTASSVNRIFRSRVVWLGGCQDKVTRSAKMLAGSAAFPVPPSAQWDDRVGQTATEWGQRVVDTRRHSLVGLRRDDSAAAHGRSVRAVLLVRAKFY